MTPEGVVSVFRADSGRTNGNTFDARGRLISCEGAEQGPGGRRRVVRTDLTTGKVEVLTERYRGEAVQQPQRRLRRRQGPDLVHRPVLRRGPLGAGDGRGGGLPDRPRRHGDAGPRPAARSSGPTGWRSRPTRRTLYVIDSHARPGGNRKVWAFDVDRRRHAWPTAAWSSTSARGGAATACGSTSGATSGSPPGSSSRAHAGETTDVPAGRLRDHAPRGSCSGRIPIPEDLTTNLAFGGPGPQDALRHRGQVDLQDPAGRLGPGSSEPASKSTTP